MVLNSCFSDRDRRRLVIVERARPDEFQRRLGERLRRVREEQRLTMKAVEVLSHRRLSR